MSESQVPSGPVRVQPGPAAGVITAPASKSVTNRLLVLAALAVGSSVLRDPLDSDDTWAMRDLVSGLGAEVTAEPGAWRVAGTGGRLRPTTDETRAGRVSAGLSGTTMRFGAALAALAEGPLTVSGDPPLLRRPIGPLTEALRSLGAEVEDDGGYPPVRLGGGGLRGGQVAVDVTASSQFATAVLMVAPYARDGAVLEVRGQGALQYVELTGEAMARWGARFQHEGRIWRVPGGQRYTARDERVEYDASAAAHLLTVGAASGGQVTVANADEQTRQPDAAFPRLLEEMGARVERRGTAVTVSGPGKLTGVGRRDLSGMPDQLPNAAVLASLAEGESVFTGVGVVRGHETDRIAALHRELSKVGVEVEQLADGLRVKGGVRPRGEVRLDTYDDHRLAMAFAALGTKTPDVVIEEPWCVTKTYPRFWDDLEQLGVAWTQVGAS